MIRNLVILLICAIADTTMCQIIPYQYMLASGSDIKLYADHERDVSLSISESLHRHIDRVQTNLLTEHELLTERYLHRLQSNGDSVDIAYMMHELNLSKLNLLDSLESLRPLRLQARQMQYIAKRKVWLPVRNSTHARLFFNMDGSGNSAQLMSHSFFSYNTESEQMALYSELFADYFGPVRFGFGALMTTGQDQSEQLETPPPIDQANQDALQRLLNGGGNSVISLAFPLLQWRDISWRKGIRILAVPKYALDIPALGNTVDTYAANADIGIEANAHWAGYTQHVALFFQTRIGYVMGNNAFKESMKTEDNFLVSQLNFGIAFRNTIKLSYTLHHISNDQVGKDLPGFISFSLIPQF